jgi:hypothetical protein
MMIIIQQVALFITKIGIINLDSNYIALIFTYLAIEVVIELLPIFIIAVHVEFFFGRFRTNLMIDGGLDPKMHIS